MSTPSRAYLVNVPAAVEVSSSGCANTARIQRRAGWFMRVVPPFDSNCMLSPPAMVQATARSEKHLLWRGHHRSDYVMAQAGWSTICRSYPVVFLRLQSRKFSTTQAWADALSLEWSRTTKHTDAHDVEYPAPPTLITRVDNPRHALARPEQFTVTLKRHDHRLAPAKLGG